MVCYSALHGNLEAILALIGTTITWPARGFALDLACGAGEKLPLLVAWGSLDLHWLAFDLDRAALAHVPAPATRVAGDAHCLPLRSAAVDAAVCIAALGLFADPAVVLSELRRVLGPTAPALLVTATQRWAAVPQWPPALADQLGMVLSNQALPLTDSDLIYEFHSMLNNAGFRGQIRAFLSDHPEPLHAELALIPWPMLRPLAAVHVDATTLAECDYYAQSAEIELYSVTLAAVGSFQP
jgi:SAM-dependent methyltransferase